jgi:hypothetical protein
MARALAPELAFGDPAQFFVDQRNEPVERPLIAAGKISN